MNRWVVFILRPSGYSTRALSRFAASRRTLRPLDSHTMAIGSVFYLHRLGRRFPRAFVLDCGGGCRCPIHIQTNFKLRHCWARLSIGEISPFHSLTSDAKISIQ